MSQFGADLERFRELNTEIVGISVDTPWALDKFATETGYNGLMVSDFNKDVSAAYDVLNPDSGASRRSVFVIDRNGTLRWTWLAGTGQLPDNEEILGVLRKL